MVVYELFLNSIPVDYYIERKYMEHELVTYHYVPWWRTRHAMRVYGIEHCQYPKHHLDRKNKIGKNWK